MTLPTQFQTTLDGVGFEIWRWLEIEGLPHCFGSKSQNSGWFSGRSALEQFSSIKPYFKGTPDQFDAQLDVLEAVAKYAGQVEFRISDIDDSLTLLAGSWDNRYTAFLGVDVTKSGATLTYTPLTGGNPLDTTNYPTGGGTIYIGNETISYTAHNTGTFQFTGCTRGKYRSRPQAWRQGAVISHKPYLLYGRRVWYYQTLKPIGGSNPTDDDKVLRFSGTLENLRLDDKDPLTFILPCVSLEREFSRPVFRNLRAYRDSTNRGIVGTDFEKPGIRFGNQPGQDTGFGDRLSGPDVTQLNEDGSYHFEDAQQYMFRVDNEFIFFQAIIDLADRNDLQLQSRAAMGTSIEEHEPGFTMKECAWIARYDSTTDIFEHLFSRFNSTPTATSKAYGDHPLIVVLQLLLSTGDGDNTPGGGARNYDVLPKDWGLGVPYDRIDIEGIEQLANDHPDLAYNGFWEDEVPFGAILKECLAPFGFYSTSLLGDVWTIRKLRPPLPLEVTREISTDDIISKSGFGWDGNLTGLVQEVKYLYDKDIKRGGYTGQAVLVNANSLQYAQNKGRQLKYELPHLYSKGPVPIPGRPALGGIPNIQLVLQERLEFFRAGFTLPPPVINLRLNYGFIDLEVGSLVEVTHDNIPEVQSGTRGVSSQIMRVLRVNIDEGSKSVECTLQDSGYGTTEFGFWAPAVRIEADLGGGDFQLNSNEFTDTDQTDALVVLQNGDSFDWLTWLLSAGSQPMLTAIKADFSQQAAVTFTDFDGVDIITLPNITTEAAWFGVGDVLVPNWETSDIVSAMRFYNAIFATQGSQLQDGGPPYKWYP